MAQRLLAALETILPVAVLEIGLMSVHPLPAVAVMVFLQEAARVREAIQLRAALALPEAQVRTQPRAAQVLPEVLVPILHQVVVAAAHRAVVAPVVAVAALVDVDKI